MSKLDPKPAWVADGTYGLGGLAHHEVSCVKVQLGIG